MHNSRHAGRHASTGAKLWWWPLVLLASAWPPSGAWASCMENPDAQIRQLQQMVAEDANKALKQAKNLLSSLQRAPLKDISHTASRTAALYAVQAEAYAILELD